jgi:PEP-CTERM motif
LSSGFTDGGGSVRGNGTSGVFYNYGASIASTGAAGYNFPTSSTSDSVQVNPTFGPTYVSWTAPQGGYITLGVQVNDHNDDGGNPSFFIVDPSKGSFETGYSETATGGLLFSAAMLQFTGAGNQANPGTMQSNTPNTTLGGTIADYNPNMGTGYVPGAYGSATATTSGSNDPTIGLSWESSTNAMYVTTGETLYFVTDAATGAYNTHSNHAFGYGKDPVSLNVNVVLQTVPEPSSFLLLGMAGVGLALAAWKRRRAAA